MTEIERQPDGTLWVGLDAQWNPVPITDAVVVKVVHPDGRIEFLDRKKDPT